MRWHAALSLAIGSFLLVAAAGCGGSGGGGGPPPPPLPGCGVVEGPAITVSGLVRYERLILTAGGVGPATELRPARHVDVEVRSADGATCFGRSSTDGSGNYVLEVAPLAGSELQVIAWSRTAEDPDRDYTVHEANPPFADIHDPNNAFSYAVTGVLASGDPIVDVIVPYAVPGRPSIGFGVLDTMVTCLDQVAAALGAPVGDAHVYTQAGNSGALGGVSYYSPSTNAVAILGGAAGNLDNSDTDYFDDAVVAHELGHFVENRFSHNMSRGGAHGAQPIEPAFAFSEGQATGFGNVLLRNPTYADSTSTDGGVIFAVNIENVTGASDHGGIGCEVTVAEILWDLGDGGAGPTDGDGDGVAVSLGSLYQALSSFAPAVDAPYIGLFLDRLVTAGAITAGQATGLLQSPENQGFAYPLTGGDIWPIPIVVGGNDAGTLDSLPAANGLKSQCRGITTTAWYRLVVAASTTVTIDLAIQPIMGFGSNLDLVLTTNQNVNAALAQSMNGGSSAEQIVRTLSPGSYIVRAEARFTGSCTPGVTTGTGNRADYVITVN